MYNWTYLRAQASVQYMYVDVTMADDSNPGAEAFNIRGGVQGLFWRGRIRPFFNFSHIMNHTFDKRGAAPITDVLSQNLFEGMTFGAGLDFDFLGQTANPDAEVGGPLRALHYLNVGASWWFMPFVCLEARYAFHLQCEDLGEGIDCGSQHHHNFFLTLRGVFGMSQAERAAQTL
jgi:hypothetical protein